MIVTYRPELPVPGTLDSGIYLIEYIIPNGVQNISHPAPGKPYVGCQFQAFVPATEEGSNVLKLLRVAFLRRLTFTIDKDQKTSWNGIYLLLHNINQHIVPNYLKKVTAELNAKGVTMDNLTQEELDDWEKLRQQLIKQ
ncbi:probable E3 ubiquitin-protein ligase DTX2 [Physella acuta]|uniref:probable E3 ubiquitin-protein ligase DTX2 n=1 Tax=Physella acuta TaxID=109671 RepID=UPI0027DBBC6C|nr:probable E3 ubiquitin-protein ligase DTX2 [Physella acuta]